MEEMLKDEPVDPSNNAIVFPKASEFLEYILEVDIPMKRQKRALVEKSIQRVTPVLKQNFSIDVDENPIEQDSENILPNESNLMVVNEKNVLNNQMVKYWKQNTATTTTTTTMTTTTAAQITKPTEKASSADIEKNKQAESEKVKKVIKFSDMGGIEPIVEEVLELIVMPIKHSEIYLYTGVKPPRGVLLYGPPGCGKTMLAKAIAAEAGVTFLEVSAPEIVSGMSGESEKKLRDLFAQAIKQAPSIIFIDEIDAITPKRETAQREMERRIVAQLLTCIDSLSWENTGNKHVVLLGATNRPDSLDPALRRAGRFDREIMMSVPDESAREKILKVITDGLKLSEDFDFRELSKRCPGYVGADLHALVTAAGMIAVKRIFSILANQDEIQDLTIRKFLADFQDPLSPDQLESLVITNQDFMSALSKVQPSAQREGFATVPGVTWESIGALQDIRNQLRFSITEPIKHPELFKSVGITSPAGVLLWGPPGCGKTLLAKAIANEAQANFISIKGPELLNKYVGESEKAIRQVFSRARASNPCIIFFDEVDALCPKRDLNSTDSISRIVNTLLTELDGIEDRKNVFIIAATNRPDIIDPAILRPGRLDKLLYVGLPSEAERLDILKTLTRNTPLNCDVDLPLISKNKRLSNFTGADLASLVRESCVSAINKFLSDPENSADPSSEASSKKAVLVSGDDFAFAFNNVSPSVNLSDLGRYLSLKEKYSSMSI
ncbi:putative AAA domain-containing protein [Zancudomyces culisetae]|uniref:Peroxisomal ATPase PEX1 n=1 Tax=Zancudomyces culisetae TaxID=1213189 RepID=A0A1R1PX24_ZANCU|nr:putative AAA domain-containing protein [Zancudomyces culisetae]|eukprot:OMH85472.1 putative AAA domain-containing protein [Zancudomyces culisetae]